MPSSKRHHVALIYREWVRFVRDGRLMIHASRIVRVKARKGMLEKLLEKAPAVDLLDNAAVIVCELLATQKVGVRVELMLIRRAYLTPDSLSTAKVALNSKLIQETFAS